MVQLACVILNYRNPGDTLACLESLTRDRAPNLKIFLVNNFPGDGSGPLLRAFLESSGVPFLYLEPGFNTGFAEGCNIGFREALAESHSHLVLLNNDATVAPGFSREVARLAALHPGEILAGKVLDASSGSVTHNIGRLSALTGRPAHIFDAGYRGEIDFVSGCLMIIPREALKTTGGFDESLFMYAEDLDLCMRFKKNGFHARYCPSILVRHKAGASAKISSLPREYYSVRNQTYVILRRGTPLQKLLYSAVLLAMPFYKAFRQPRTWTQSMRGVWDGITGRMGRTHPGD